MFDDGTATTEGGSRLQSTTRTHCETNKTEQNPLSFQYCCCCCCCLISPSFAFDVSQLVRKGIGIVIPIAITVKKETRLATSIRPPISQHRRKQRILRHQWRPMATNGDQWRPMATCGDLWRPMATNGDLWQLMAICGN